MEPIARPSAETDCEPVERSRGRDEDMTTRTPTHHSRSPRASAATSSPVPKPVVAVFAALRKAFGRAEDERDQSDTGSWALCIVVEADPIDGGFIAECPDVPGAMSQGETEREAFENLIHAINAIVELKMEQHLDSIDFAVSAATGRCTFSIQM